MFGVCYATSKEVGSYLIFIDIPCTVIIVIIALAYSFDKTNKLKACEIVLFMAVGRVSYMANINERWFCL